MTHAIEVQELTKRFGALVPVDALSLSVEAGEVLGLLRHNGAGKPTTVRLLNGVLSPDGGPARTLDLDPAAARDVHALSQGRSVILCTHNLDEAQRLCDRVAVLERGRLPALGTPHELASRLDGAARIEIETAPDHAERACALLHEAGLEAAVEGSGRLSAAGVARERVPDRN